MARPLGEGAVRVGEQRRRAGDEEPHPLCRFARQPGIVEQPCVEGRHAHQRRRPRHPVEHFAGLNFGRKIMLPPAISVTLVATNSPCVWKIGSAWISTSSGVKRHASTSACGVGAQILVAEHRALRPPGRARRVEHGGEIARPALDVPPRRRVGGCRQRRQRAVAGRSPASRPAHRSSTRAPSPPPPGLTSRRPAPVRHRR